MKTWTAKYLREFLEVISAIPAAEVAALIELLRQACTADRQIFVCGNGGSAANASHFVTDLGKGSSDKIGRRFRCLSLSDNTSWITAIANDYSYEDIFVRQLQNFARKGDLLLVLSVSGNSPNLVKAVKWANMMALTTVALVGEKRGVVGTEALHAIVIPSGHYGYVEDAQMAICHMLCYAFMENPGVVEQ